MTKIKVPPDKQVCGNCRHLLWWVALGQGARCRHPGNWVPGVPVGDGARLPLIPGRLHMCQHFEWKQRPSGHSMKIGNGRQS